jgi:hypothetical protein
MFRLTSYFLAFVSLYYLACVECVEEKKTHYLAKRQVITSCATSPCLNGGTCVTVGISLAYCACPTGYAGYNCALGMATTTLSTTTATLSLCVPGICQNGKSFFFHNKYSDIFILRKLNSDSFK